MDFLKECSHLSPPSQPLSTKKLFLEQNKRFKKWMIDLFRFRFRYIFICKFDKLFTTLFVQIWERRLKPPNARTKWQNLCMCNLPNVWCYLLWCYLMLSPLNGAICGMVCWELPDLTSPHQRKQEASTSVRNQTFKNVFRKVKKLIVKKLNVFVQSFKCVCPNPIGWNSAKYSARFFWLSLKPKSSKLNEITKKHSIVRLIEKPNSRIVRDKNWDVLPWFSAMWVGGSKFYNSETGNPT